MKIRLLALIFLINIILLHTSLLSQESATCQALITDINGTALIKKSQLSDFETAVWGTQLFIGDLVKTMAASSASILFTNNNLITLGANSSLTIAQNLLNQNSDSHSTVNLTSELSDKTSLITFRQKENGEVGALAGLRSGTSNEIILISPRNSKILTLKPEFKWQTYKEYESYKIVLFDDRGKIWTREVSGSPYKLSENDKHLIHGKSYFWYVEGKDLFNTERSESIGFKIPKKEELTDLLNRSDKILKMFKNNSNSNSFRFVLGSFYEKEGYYLDAIEYFEIIARMNQNAPLPHQILGNLYQKINLKDLAIHELQKAVELSNEKE